MIYQNRIFDHNATRESGALIVVNEESVFSFEKKKNVFRFQIHTLQYHFSHKYLM